MPYEDYDLIELTASSVDVNNVNIQIIPTLGRDGDNYYYNIRVKPVWGESGTYRG